MTKFLISEIAIIFTLLQTAHLYPETGLYLHLNETKDVLPDRWTQIKGWHLSKNDDDGRNERAVFLSLDINVIQDTTFVAPRSGLYYVSLYLEFKDSKAEENYANINVTNNTFEKTYCANITVTNSKSKKIHYFVKTVAYGNGNMRHLKLEDILILNRMDSFEAFIYTSHRNKLTHSSRIFLHFINRYEHIIGFVATPKKQSIVPYMQPQVIVGWNICFDLVNGFSETTGEYVIFRKGYYLIVAKLLFQSVIGNITLLLEENGNKFCHLENFFSNYTQWETFTYVGVRILNPGTTITLKLYSSSKSTFISSYSTYSILYLSSLQKGVSGGGGFSPSFLRRYSMKIDKDGKLLSRRMDSSRIFFNGNLVVRRSGHYIVILDVLLNKIPSLPLKLKFTFHHGSHTTGIVYSAVKSVRLSLTGVFYIREREAMSCVLDSKEELKLLKGSLLTIYRIEYHTHTYMFPVRHSYDSTELNEKYSLHLNQSANDFVKVTQDQSSLKIIEDGVYYLVLNIFVGKFSDCKTGFSIMHKHAGGKWTVFTTCYLTQSYNCYLPIQLFLQLHDEVGVWKSSNSECGKETINSTLLVQFMKNKTPQSVASVKDIRKRVDMMGHLVTGIYNSSGKKFPFGSGITVLNDGVYLITFNIMVENTSPAYNGALQVELFENDFSKLNLEKRMLNASFINVPFTTTLFLLNGTRLSISVKCSNKSWIVMNISSFSALLLTNDKGRYFSVKESRQYRGNRPLKNKASNIWNIVYRTDKEKNKYLKYYYSQIIPKSSLFALISITVIVEIKKIDKSCSTSKCKIEIKAAPKKSKNSWANICARKWVDGRSDQIVNLHISGMVIMQAGDAIDIDIKFDKLTLLLHPGTRLSVVVMEDGSSDIPFSYFLPLPIPFEELSGENSSQALVTAQRGVYNVYFKVSNKPKTHKRIARDVEATYRKNASLSEARYRKNASLSEATYRTNASLSDVSAAPMLNASNVTASPNPVNRVSSTPLPTTGKICKVSLKLTLNPSLHDPQLIDIWDKALLQFNCVSCAHEFILATELPKKSSLKVFSEHCPQLATSLSMQPERSAKVELVEIDSVGETHLCLQSGYSTMKWRDAANLESFYISPDHGIIHLFINLFIRQDEEHRILLVTNGQLGEGVDLTISRSSANTYTYSLYRRLFMKRHSTLQLYVLCGNQTAVTRLKTSRIAIVQKKEVMHAFQDSFPVFVKHPHPVYIDEPLNYTFTCALATNTSYRWNKIALHSSNWTVLPQTKSLPIEGVPEESGHYFCSAKNGPYEAFSNFATVNIADDNECEMIKKNESSELRPCHQNANCINTVGSYRCECKKGYEGDGYLSCEDINECLEVGKCGNNSICTNLNGTFNCSCEPNYRGFNGMNCIDIDECAENPPDFCLKELSLSSNVTYCHNLPGSYDCRCIKGYAKKYQTCEDVDECNVDPKNYPCDDNASCNNTIGSFKCYCDKGFEGNGFNCTDINECETGNFSCQDNATCVNQPGSYRCKCDRGFKLIPTTNECASLGCTPPPVCSGQYMVSWWSRKPYIDEVNSTDGAAQGLFKDILKLMVEDICNNCSLLYFQLPHNGSYDLEKQVENNETDIGCPIYGSKEQETFRGFPFIPIVEAPGVTFFVKDQEKASNSLVGSLAGSWPILVVTLLLASLSGVIIWFLDTVRNPNEFPHSFLQGAWEGFWWAFITMTTVGYGDKAPRSFFARIFGIVWILIGLVIISTFTATITTVLTASSLSDEAKLYGTKVGALRNSEEFRLGVKRNADVKGYASVPDIIAALHRGDIQGALLDTYIAGEFQGDLQDYKLQEILEHVFVYGVVLARDAQNLDKKIRTYIERKQSKIYHAISQRVKPLKENKASKKKREQSGTLFDSDSPFFRTMLIAGSSILVLLLLTGVLWDRFYWRWRGYKDKQKAANNNDEYAPVHQSWKTYDVIEFQKHAFKTEVLDLKKQITDFSELWANRLDEMEGIHEQKLSSVQKWLGRSTTMIGNGEVMKDRTERDKKKNGWNRIFLLNTQEDAL